MKADSQTANCRLEITNCLFLKALQRLATLRAVSKFKVEHYPHSPIAPESPTMKVLLVDDHPLILSALQTVIEGLGSHVVVTGVGSARAARAALQADADFDLVLLDLHLGDADGFTVLAEFRSQYPALPVVVVSASDRTSDVIRAIDLGAMGFVPKRASNEALFEALHMVMSGGIYVPVMTLGELGSGLEPVVGDVLPHENGELPVAAPSPLELLRLTPRQTGVLKLMLKGHTNKLIARELDLSVDTVKDHVAAVLRSLNVTSRTQAVLAVGQLTSQAGSQVSWHP
jgi:DNA-binding NarL/FixJ family response regulator